MVFWVKSTKLKLQITIISAIFLFGGCGLDLTGRKDVTDEQTSKNGTKIFSGNIDTSIYTRKGAGDLKIFSLQDSAIPNPGGSFQLNSDTSGMERIFAENEVGEILLIGCQLDTTKGYEVNIRSTAVSLMVMGLYAAGMERSQEKEAIAAILSNTNFPMFEASVKDAILVRKIPLQNADSNLAEAIYDFYNRIKPTPVKKMSASEKPFPIANYALGNELFFENTGCAHTYYVGVYLNEKSQKVFPISGTKLINGSFFDLLTGNFSNENSFSKDSYKAKEEGEYTVKINSGLHFGDEEANKAMLANVSEIGLIVIDGYLGKAIKGWVPNKVIVALLDGFGSRMLKIWTTDGELTGSKVYAFAADFIFSNKTMIISLVKENAKELLTKEAMINTERLEKLLGIIDLFGKISALGNASKLVYDWDSSPSELQLCKDIQNDLFTECVRNLKINGSTQNLFLKDSLKLSASFFDSTGKEIKGKQALWTLSNTKSASITSTGLLLPIDTGLVVVSAKFRSLQDSINISIKEKLRRGYCEDGKTLKFQVEINSDTLFDGLYEYFNCKTGTLESISHYKNGILDGDIEVYVNSKHFPMLSLVTMHATAGLLEGPIWQFGTNPAIGYYRSGLGSALHGKLVTNPQSVKNGVCGENGSPDYQGTAKFELGVFSLINRLEYCPGFSHSGLIRTEIWDKNMLYREATSYCTDTDGSGFAKSTYDYENGVYDTPTLVCTP